MAAQARKVARHQLRNKHWLVFFEDNACMALESSHSSVCMKDIDRLDVQVLVCFLNLNRQFIFVKWNLSEEMKLFSRLVKLLK